MMTRTKIFCFFLHFVALLYCVNTEKCCWTCLNLQMHLMAWDFPLKRRKKGRENGNCTLANSCSDFEMILPQVLLIWIIRVTNGPFLPLSCTYNRVPIMPLSIYQWFLMLVRSLNCLLCPCSFLALCLSWFPPFPLILTFRPSSRQWYII